MPQKGHKVELYQNSDYLTSFTSLTTAGAVARESVLLPKLSSTTSHSSSRVIEVLWWIDGFISYNQWIKIHNRIDLTGAKYQCFNCSKCSVPGYVLKSQILQWNKKSQRTSCQERKKGNTLTTMCISSFINWSCISESWVCCLYCSNIWVHAIWSLVIPTALLWDQGSSPNAFHGQKSDSSGAQVCPGTSSLLDPVGR